MENIIVADICLHSVCSPWLSNADLGGHTRDWITLLFWTKEFPYKSQVSGTLQFHWFTLLDVDLFYLLCELVQQTLKLNKKLIENKTGFLYCNKTYRNSLQINFLDIRFIMFFFKTGLFGKVFYICRSFTRNLKESSGLIKIIFRYDHNQVGFVWGNSPWRALYPFLTILYYTVRFVFYAV